MLPAGAPVLAGYHPPSWLAVAPDGKGSGVSPERVLMRPFHYTAAENFYGRSDMNRSIMIPVPPFFAIGRGYVTSAFVFLKRGYLRIVMHGSDYAKTETLTLRADSTKQAERVVEAVLNRDTGSALLSRPRSQAGR